MNETQKLLKMKEEIERRDKRVSQIEGALSEQMRRMKKDHKCSNLKEADKKLQSYVKSRRGKEEEIRQGTKKLEKDYPWGDL